MEWEYLDGPSAHHIFASERKSGKHLLVLSREWMGIGEWDYY
jgi:hypothetical protein